MADPIHIPPAASRDIGRYHDRAEVLEALQRGDAPISEIMRRLPTGVTQRDILNYLRDQSREYRNVIQENPGYAAQGEMPQPSPEFFSQDYDSNENSLDDEDRDLLANSLLAGARAQVAKSESASGGDEPRGAQSAEELQAAAEGTVAEFEEFTLELNAKIEERRMIEEFKQKDSEVKSEVLKIFSDVKAGILPPEYALLAVLKVHQSRSGSAMVMIGSKMQTTQERDNRRTQRLSASPTAAEMYALQGENRQDAMTLQQDATTLQQLTTGVATAIDHVKGMMDDIKRMREQLIQKMGVG